MRKTLHLFQQEKNTWNRRRKNVFVLSFSHEKKKHRKQKNSPRSDELKKMERHGRHPRLVAVGARVPNVCWAPQENCFCSRWTNESMRKTLHPEFQTFPNSKRFCGVRPWGAPKLRTFPALQQIFSLHTSPSSRIHLPRRSTIRCSPLHVLLPWPLGKNWTFEMHNSSNITYAAQNRSTAIRQANKAPSRTECTCDFQH